MSSGTLNAWLRTAFLALAAALLLDHVVTTTPPSTATPPSLTGPERAAAQTDPADDRPSARSRAGWSRAHRAR